jgi:signal transduction histidine kinase
MLAASGLLAVIIAGAFAVVLLAIADLRRAQQDASHSQQVLTASSGLERLLLDLETGERGFILTRQQAYLAPWLDARAQFPARARALRDLVAGEPVQEQLASRIAADETSYIRDYSSPLVNAARRGDGLARSIASVAEGQRRVDAMRGSFERLIAVESGNVARSDAAADTAAWRAKLAAAGGLAGSIALVALYAGYLTRAIVRPVRRAALMADRLAGGDLAARLVASGPDEVGALERSLNVMADSLEKGRDELARLAEEQAALRRVATLVARAAPLEALFGVVTEEVAQVLSAEIALMASYGADETVTFAAGFRRTCDPVPAGTRGPLRLGGRNVATLVAQTRKPARLDDHAEGSGPLADALGEMGIRAAVGTPIMVAGRLWGVMIVGSLLDEPFPADTETRLTGFTDLVATAVANAESRAALAASRVRLVATADRTRRQIERDLHDGAQQRLVALALDLRAAQAAVPPQLDELQGELTRVADGMASVLDELREMARGIHPAILAEGGLGPALRTLARRSPVPVQLAVRTAGRLPERVEVAAYYVVSEALANAAKHAGASLVRVELEQADGLLHLAVRDDGVGGADPLRGSGLVGLSDRVEALGGTIAVESRAGAGTALRVELPLAGDGAAPEVPASR